ncbi:MAG: EthD domain-containing protein [Proteobacteria bacterium]|nr:EthD domain-containing protein [Pseudomonadota bacterium]
MFKVMILIKRKNGMSVEAFRNYYETKHAPLGASKIPNLKRYVRHFISPFGNAIYAADAEPPYDVLTELWFDDEADFDRGMAYLSEPETAAIIGADEEKLFEKSSIRFMVMEDHETDLTKR